MHKNLLRITDNLPAFPPRKVIGKNDPEFIRKRCRQLQTYFEELPTYYRVEKTRYFIDLFNFNEIKAKWDHEIQADLQSQLN